MEQKNKNLAVITMSWKDVKRAKMLANQGKIVVLTHPVSMTTLKIKRVTKIICSDVKKLEAFAQLMNLKKLVAGLKVHQEPIPHYDLWGLAEERFFREAKKAGVI